MNSSYASHIALFSKHPQTSLWELESIHDIVGRPLSPQYFIISANSAGTAFLFISSYTDINTISGKSSFPVFHIHAATSGDIIPVIGHAFISGVVTIAALGFFAANTCVPFGRDVILPPLVHGSCKHAKNGVLLHSTIQEAKFASASFDFCKLICLMKINCSSGTSPAISFIIGNCNLL